MTRKRVPDGLGDAGAAFFRQVHRVYELDERDAPVLLEVCRTLDEIDSLSVVVAAEGVMSTGSAGQPVEHPAMAGLRAHRATLDRLLVRLGLPDAEGQKPLSARQIRAKTAASKRWQGHVPERQRRSGGASWPA